MLTEQPIQLLIILVQRIGLLVGLAFLATRSRSFRRLAQGGSGWPGLARVAVVFGLFGIVGTYTGVVVSPQGPRWEALATGPLTPEDAIANSRAVSLVVAGLIGGPWAGLFAGLIAGVHRYFVGGFTALACGVAAVTEGSLAGVISRRYIGGPSRLTPARTFLVAALMEALQMAIILLIARPFDAAVALVELIAIPMTLVNAVGVALFIGIARSILTEEAAREGDAARKALLIANRTLPYLRRGLNRESAAAAARVIKEETGLPAAAVTDTEQILAHVGLGSDHHVAGLPLQTNITRQAVQQDRILVGEGVQEIECVEPGCSLRGVVVAPLHENNRIVGTLKLYYDPTGTQAPKDLAEGLAHLFSTQLALARAEEQARLVDKAEIRALQAQIQPHFLFNALNTVMALIRRDPSRARDVLGHLGDFIRQNLHSTQCETVTLKQELEHVRHYLTVEEARYGDRLKVGYEIDEGALDARLPPLTLQPLVENAVVHGIKSVREGRISIHAGVERDRVVIAVRDTGRGIEPERLKELLQRPVSSQTGSGLALHNVHQRLQGLYGQGAGLHIVSTPGKGTTVTITLPLNTQKEKEEELHAHPHSGGR